MPAIERAPKRETETTISAAARAACNSLPGVRLWRNNVGKLQDATGRYVEYGLAPGSADLVGSVLIRITVEVGETGQGRPLTENRWIGRPFALEMKHPDRRYAHREILIEQRKWHNAVRALGWYTGSNVASVEEALEHVKRAQACIMQGPVETWDAARGRCPYCLWKPGAEVGTVLHGARARHLSYQPHECTP